MEVVIVCTSNTGVPEGYWKASPNHARAVDYVVEERNGKIHAVYEFSNVSNRNADGRFSFDGLKDVTNTAIGQKIKNNLDVSRSQGESQPVRYASI